MWISFKLTKNVDYPHFLVGRYLNNNQLKELPKGVLDRFLCLSVLHFTQVKRSSHLGEKKKKTLEMY